jgi:hypothetical protein
MPRPRRRKDRAIFTPDLNCLNKRRFKTELEAIDAADHRMLENMTVELDVYICPNCRYWHLTRRIKEKQ